MNLLFPPQPMKRGTISVLFVLLLLFGAGFLFGPTEDSNAEVYSVILEGGTIYDGSGEEPFVADVGLEGARIAFIGDLSDARAGLRLDASGLAVAPGFIDIHSHATSSTPERSGIFQRPLAENYVRQGVTSVMGGQDGSSPLQIGEYLARFEAEPAAVNLGLFVGHGSVRSHVMGSVDRAPTEDELNAMKELIRRGMEDGAFGLSSGLEYTPGAYSDTEELIALAREITPYDGLYISHIRNEGGMLLESVEEVIRIGEEAGIPAQVTHHKVVGPDRWGRSEASLQLLEEARARGVDVTSDVYPYAASSTGLTILFPSWSREGGSRSFAERLEDPETRSRIRDAIAQHLNEERGGDPSTVVLSRCSWNDSLDGKSLADVLEEQEREVTVEEAAELAMELQAEGGCSVVLHSMAERDVRRIMQHPTTMIASDGGIPNPGVGAPHPRNYGTFARVLGRYAREEGVLSMEEAIHKMTRLPAERLDLEGRGRLEEGAVADIAVFDPDEIIDHATFAEPHQFATGVRHVFVSGQATLVDGELTGVRAGQPLRATN